MPIRIVSNLWKADWHLSVLLGLLLLVVFVLYPISGHSLLFGMVVQLFFSLILITGVVLVASRRRVMVLATVLAAATAIIGWIRLYEPQGWLVVPSMALWILFFAMLAGVILMRVFGEDQINRYHIQGAVAVYLLIGVMWSGCYRLVVQFDPGAFTITANADESILMSKLVYFSFVTLTTVGYGDITAVNAAARSLAVLEALTGQLFPAVLIARLVALEVGNRQDK